MMKFGSLFSGIGGFDLGFERAGMRCAWQCEIDPKAREVLRKHFDVEVFDDVRSVDHNAEPVDLICGGFPCQDVSIAGRRAGLAGERSGLWFEFARAIDELSPRWVVIENVPGLLSSNRGADFDTIIRWLVQRGYGVAWRILDAQYFGVAQRRRRVFVVGCLGDGRAAEVLFEPGSLQGNYPQGRKTGKEIAHALTASPTGSGRQDPSSETYIAGNVLTSIPGRDASDAVNEHLIVETINAGAKPGGFNGQDAYTENYLQIAYKVRGGKDGGGKGYLGSDKAFALHGVEDQRIGMRRLMPSECEKLQGFPPGWNDWLKDTHRYKQFGNAVCVPVAEWIGKRIVEVEGIVG